MWNLEGEDVKLRSVDSNSGRRVRNCAIREPMSAIVGVGSATLLWGWSVELFDRWSRVRGYRDGCQSDPDAQTKFTSQTSHHHTTQVLGEY